MGCLRGGRRLRRLPPFRSRLGPWPPSCDQCFLARREGLCGMAVAQDGKEVPPAERSRTRICGAGRNGHSVLVGQFDLDGAGELRREPCVRWGPERRVSTTNTAGRVLPAKSL